MALGRDPIVSASLELMTTYFNKQADLFATYLVSFMSPSMLHVAFLVHSDEVDAPW